VRRALLMLAACAAPVEPKASLIDQPTVIAVTIDPPETKPGKDVTATVVVATPDGDGDASGAKWALCTDPKPVTDNNSVAGACLHDDPTATGATITQTLSTDACALFGPDPPPGGFRPRDPDPTGGYYQPLRVDVADAQSFGLARVYCHLANAPLDASRQYDASYVLNTAPSPDAPYLDPAEVHVGDTAAIVVRWPDGTRERYLHYDVASQALDEIFENLTVSWYATGGAMQLDRTVGLATGAVAQWTAPDTPGPLHVWAVVRDDRGGVGVSDLAVDVLP